ncbi:uncharacterized protein LOC124913421 [Impatiens glandulifera]|uniref:uncharacterized protein LOC124913421 n=1 Tax=Impatiens glandulifera TaxID=253017 RepID=UPI001FB1923E|nr:uncharacterized protein LOC124913421 [Impatiens glandulifera]
MVIPDSTRSWGYAIPLGKIMLHHNINTGPGVLLSSSKIIKSRQFKERKSNRKVSKGGRKKIGAKKANPVKEKSGSKKPIEFADPPSETQNEDDSASSSDRTASQNTEENESGKGKGPMDEASLENADTSAEGPEEENIHANDNTKEMAEKIVRRIIEEIHQQAQEVSDVFLRWFQYWNEIFYKQMLPGLTAEQKFERLMEEEVNNLTKAQDPNEALNRHVIVKPRARLQRLAEHIQRLTKKYTPGTPNSRLQLLVLELLAVKERELTEEVARLEAVPEHQDTANSPTHKDDGGHTPINEVPASHPADQTVQMTDERTETPLTDARASDQTGDSEPAITEEKVISIIEEFANKVVRPWKKKIKKNAVQAVKIAETTRDELGEAFKRITSVETNYGKADVLYVAHLKRTITLEDMTPKLVDDLESVSQRVVEMERSQEETGQRLTKVDEDLGRSSTQAGSTLDRVIHLEDKNATLEERNNKLEADLKAVTEQVTELIKTKLAADKAIEEANAQAAKELQDALDEQNRTEKGVAWYDANFAEHIRHLTAKNPELAKTMAAKQAEEANRLKAQQDTYHNFEKAHKKSQAAPSSLVPATRKRKAPSKKAQVTEMLDRITETVVDPPLNPALHTEDDFEEDFQPQLTRQRIFDAVPIRTVGQQFPSHTGTSGAGGSSSRPTKPAKGQTTDDLMDEFLPSKLKK